jgi:hypothetical protein
VFRHFICVDAKLIEANVLTDALLSFLEQIEDTQNRHPTLAPTSGMLNGHLSNAAANRAAPSFIVLTDGAAKDSRKHGNSLRTTALVPFSVVNGGT